MDSYKEKIKRDFQYQLEEVYDWTVYLKHLQVVLQEYNPVMTPNEEILIWYFWKSLKPFIRV